MNDQPLTPAMRKVLDAINALEPAGVLVYQPKRGTYRIGRDGLTARAATFTELERRGLIHTERASAIGGITVRPVPPPGDIVGERVQEEREYLGLDRAQVARVCGLRGRDIAGIEEGTRRVSDQEMERLVKLFGLDSPARLRGEPIPPGPPPLCTLASGPITHEDYAAVNRFREFLRNAGPAPHV